MGEAKPRFRRCAASLECGAERGDITYIWTAEGWLYLAVILDLPFDCPQGRALKINFADVSLAGPSTSLRSQ